MQKTSSRCTSPKFNSSLLQERMVGRLLCFWDGLFSAILNFQGVLTTRAKMSKVDREIEGLILFGEEDVDMSRYVLNKKPLETLFRGVQHV